MGTNAKNRLEASHPSGRIDQNVECFLTFPEDPRFAVELRLCGSVVGLVESCSPGIAWTSNVPGIDGRFKPECRQDLADGPAAIPGQRPGAMSGLPLPRGTLPWAGDVVAGYA